MNLPNTCKSEFSHPPAAAQTALASESPVKQSGCGHSLAWVLLSVTASLALRASFLHFQSGDYKAFLGNWYDFLLQNGRWNGLGKQFSSYPPLYLYMLSLSSFLPIPKLFAIKLISIIFDYIGAYYIWRLASLSRAIIEPDNSSKGAARAPDGNTSKAFLTTTAFLFLPTIVLNSAAWGQCDIIYTTCFIASLLYTLTNRPMASLVAFGFACSLKPQAIFWCPFLLGLLLSGFLCLRSLWVPFAVYAVCSVPQMFAGRPVLRALGHWFTVGDYPGLTHGAVPNWYSVVSPQSPRLLWWVGVILTLAASAALASYMTHLMNRPMDVKAPHERGREIVSFALLSVLIPPFLLPGMHERYFFASDVLSILYACFTPGGWPVAVLIQLGSLLSYIPYLFKYTVVPTSLVTLAPALAIAIVTVQLSKPQIRFKHS